MKPSASADIRKRQNLLTQEEHMKYQVLTLDLDGTLTNSKKEITPPTREALIDIQKAGRILILASGRPINGVAPLARKLEMEKYGGYMLSFNGARITKCSTC